MGADICSGFAVTVVIVMAAMVGVLVEITALVYSGREIGVGTGVATKMIELVGRERRDIARTDGEKSTGCLVVFATVAAVAVLGPLLGLMSVSHVVSYRFSIGTEKDD
ncbi:BnaCnng32050D [Brassica napus]|uniref:(rape) hypothetical protein n=1 Tax=Brassica napus TaxID=3708 RepID=A0A078IYS9_BRANA|nr:unnamed protein product [Brassica napus]CDY57427.1 BnaCnng32050D [Brassica napus]